MAVAADERVVQRRRAQRVVIDQLYHTEEQHLPLNEAIRRIAPAFRRVSIDRVRGDAGIREQEERLIDLNAPDVILQSHRSQLGVTAWVSVADEDGPDEWVEFVLAHYPDVFVHHRSERLRPTVAKLAVPLGYQVIVHVRKFA